MKSPSISVQQFIELFYNQKMPVKELSKITGLSASGISSFRRRNRLPARGRSPFSPKRIMAENHPFKNGYGKNKLPWNKKHPDFFLCKGCSVQIKNSTGHVRTFCSRSCYAIFLKRNNPENTFQQGALHWNYVKDRTKVISRKTTVFSSKEQKIIAEKYKYCCNGCAKNLDTPEAFYKKKPKMSFDHIVPIRLGGLHSIDNSQLLCRDCNSEKTRNDLKKIIKIRHE